MEHLADYVTRAVEHLTGQTADRNNICSLTSKPGQQFNEKSLLVIQSLAHEDTLAVFEHGDVFHTANRDARKRIFSKEPLPKSGTGVRIMQITFYTLDRISHSRTECPAPRIFHQGKA